MYSILFMIENMCLKFIIISRHIQKETSLKLHKVMNGFCTEQEERIQKEGAVCLKPRTMALCIDNIDVEKH